MVVTSVARPVRPRYASPYEKILGKLLETVRACMPNLKSQPMATQSLPTLFLTVSGREARCCKDRSVHGHDGTAVYAERARLMVLIAMSTCCRASSGAGGAGRKVIPL